MLWDKALRCYSWGKGQQRYADICIWLPTNSLESDSLWEWSERLRQILILTCFLFKETFPFLLQLRKLASDEGRELKFPSPTTAFYPWSFRGTPSQGLLRHSEFILCKVKLRGSISKDKKLEVNNSNRSKALFCIHLFFFPFSKIFCINNSFFFWKNASNLTTECEILVPRGTGIRKHPVTQWLLPPYLFNG